MKEFVLGLLTTPSVREALLAQAGAGDDATMGRTLSDLGAAQSRLQGLDDDFYVRGVLAEGRYRSIRVRLEREIDRLHAVVVAGTKHRIVLHPDPRAFWAEADFQQRRDLALVQHDPGPAATEFVHDDAVLRATRVTRQH
ncbi:MAG: hypothetical protein ACR2KK_23935 [Acidimicrobiales bacterium]